MNTQTQKHIKGQIPLSARGSQTRSISPNINNVKEQLDQANKSSHQSAQPQQTNEKILDSHNDSKVKRDKQIEQQYKPRWQNAQAIVRNNDLSKSPFKKESTNRKTHLSSSQLQQSINKLACSGEFHPESNFKATLQTVFGRRNRNFALEESSISNRGDLETSTITQDENLESFYKEIEKNKKYLESQRRASSVSPMPMSKSLLEMLENNNKRVERVYQKVHQQVQNNVSETNNERSHSKLKTTTFQKELFNNEEIQSDFPLKNGVHQQASPLQEVNDEEIEDNNKESNKEVKLDTPKKDNLEDEFSIIPYPSPDSNKDKHETTIAHTENGKDIQINGHTAKDIEQIHQNGDKDIEKQQPKSTQKNNISTSSGFSFVGKYKKKEISNQQTSLSKIRRKSNETFQGSNQLYQKLQESQRVAQQNMRNMITSPARRNDHSLNKISKKVLQQESLISERRQVSSQNSETQPKAENDTPSNHMFILKRNKPKDSAPAESFQEQVEQHQQQNIEQKKQSEKSKIILIKGRGSKHLENDSKNGQQQGDSTRDVEELSIQNKQKDLEIQRLSQQVQFLTDQMENQQNRYFTSSNQKNVFTSSGEKDHLNYHNQDDANSMFRGSFTPSYNSHDNSEQNSRLEQNNHQERETYFSAGKNGKLQQRQMSFSVQKDHSASEEEQSYSLKDGQDIPIPHTPFLPSSHSQGSEQINNFEVSMTINQSQITGEQINLDTLGSSVQQPNDQPNY